MPKHPTYKKVLVIGSGPIVIGQAAEFDYAGTQACAALQEEGCEVILVNNNPATIMTDHEFANEIYFEPLTVPSLTAIIEKEKPDGILGTVGGQTGLNLTVELHQAGILEKYGVKVLGTSPESIIQGEDREAFRSLMHQLGEPVPPSEIIGTVEEACEFAEKIGFPLIVRPAYTLGGGGGGIVDTLEQLTKVVQNGLDASPITQCLLEKSIAGFKELEFEMMRDDNDTCLAICSMENFDPVGVHTGDSIVIAPQQTLSGDEYEALHASALKIIRALNIIGGCNIQFAQDPDSSQYYLIEVNPRLSRSSALASKAVGYPIARIAAKVGLGYHLHEILNPVTGMTFASSEPVVDYTVVKMPRLPFDKFSEAETKLGTQMKATGEIMAIEKQLPQALQKAIRSLEVKLSGLVLDGIGEASDEQLWKSVKEADHIRLFSILELMRRGVSVDEIAGASHITKRFLQVLDQLIALEKEAKETNIEDISPAFLRTLKKQGFTDEWLAGAWGCEAAVVREKRKELGIIPVYHMVDSCAGEFPAEAPYFYSTWNGGHDRPAQFDKPKIAIIGSGPIRIGQGLEFDYCTVHGAWALKKEGYETVLINNNPGTVSTDFQVADRLYFEPLHLEDVLNVLQHEKPDGVIVSFGGQTAINLAEGLEKAGIPLLSINQDQIDRVEDRERFYELLNQLDIPHIPGLMAENAKELAEKAEQLGYPILLRPSYVIGGQGMEIVEDENALDALLPSIQYPVLVDAYYRGTELEIDVLSDGKDVFIPGFFEHLEKAGVHSGDSMAVTPPVTVEEPYMKLAEEYARKLAEELEFKGLFNIQFVIHEGILYVLEVNPRASRTVPLISKISGINIIEESIKTMIGKPLAITQPEPAFYALKNPVFSTGKLPGVDPVLTPGMKSTGEVIAFGHTFEEALAKAVHWKKDGKNKAAVYVDVPAEAEKDILQLLNDTGAIAVTEKQGSIKEALKQHPGLILYSEKKDKEGEENRIAASLSQLLVITERETLIHHLAAEAPTIGEPQTVKQWQTKNKEKVN